MDVFWAIKGGMKLGSKENKKIVVENAVVLSVSNYVANEPRSEMRKKFVSSESHRIGRPGSLNELKLRELLRLYYSYPYSFRELADMFGVSRMTVWRAVQTARALVTTR